MSTNLVERLWGCGDLDRLFVGGAGHTIAPWPKPGRPKRGRHFDGDAVVAILSQPVDLVELDPREVWASQPGVVRHHVSYYLSGRWEVSGRTSADRYQETNRFPVIVPDYLGRPLILSGHHRTAAALIEGRPVRARVATLGPTFHVTPDLRVDPAAGTTDVLAVANLLASGAVATVPDLVAARGVLQIVGVAAEDIALAVDRAERRLSAWRHAWT